MGEIVTFTATGSPQVVSRAIEEYARGQGHVSAIVVPWESDGTTLSMAVTAVKSDGWAIEHTNLGRIGWLEGAGGTTKGPTAPDPQAHPDHKKPPAFSKNSSRKPQTRF